MYDLVLAIKFASTKLGNYVIQFVFQVTLLFNWGRGRVAPLGNVEGLRDGYTDPW